MTYIPKVVYTAPNRAHHYKYAKYLNDRGLLLKFISGFSRFSPRSELSEIGDKLIRTDYLQNLYLASLKLPGFGRLSKEIAYWAKLEQDNKSSSFLEEADIFMFYNGSGLRSCTKSPYDFIKVVEAVNSHVLYQESILKEEYKRTGLEWKSKTSAKEVARRIEEYEIADYILVPSQFVANSFKAYGFQEDKIIKVPYGFELPDRRDFAKKDSESFNVLYVGSVSVRKGLRYLINAFKEFEYPNKKLTIVGPISSETGLENIELPQEVDFKGVLKGEDLTNEYLKATVFCLPTVEDGFGLVLGEALSFGIPLITTENSGGLDIIEDNKEGYIVPIRDSSAIARKFQELADNPELLRKMRQSAIEKSKKLGGWKDTGFNLSKILIDIANN
ncbi:glycosyltransferase family 4 protein [Zunongwangia profunda]|uniref:glycosyltransferase family 4 protein n=1 Tax=Zunongwangia profunda TaxID=398743 RepID=UPI00248EE908|nr:glycosyltransferase family 4 protein [Zunongwangia profunda]|tara:strand:- start:6619 stop:7782 length:1164 start_codon:yes stop_codon:yes gene_type:complete